MLSCVIIDDEDQFIGVIKEYLKNFPQINILGEAHSVKDSISLISKVNPDLLFLDIELLDGMSFEILSHFPNRNFQVIFTTGHNDYAIKAIKHSAIDYLLKPIAKEDFTLAVNKAIKLKGNELSAKKLELMLSNMTKNEFSKIAIPSIDSFEFINKKDIIYCEADVSYTTIFLESKKVVSTNNIKKIEAVLTESNFFRLHKSFIVNIEKIQKVLKTDGGSVIMPNDIQIPIARRRKDDFLKIIGIS